VRPTLVDALTDQDEGVRLSALIGLQRVGGLEPSQVPAVEAHLLTGSDEIRAGAAATLRCSNPAAAPAAAAALTRALQRQKVSRVFRLGVDDADSPMVVEATARALVAVGGAEGRKAVKERASRAQGDLAKKLTDLLRST
jgi:DNA-binding helix-hairpin-helix protein with protein kinase domain